MEKIGNFLDYYVVKQRLFEKAEEEGVDVKADVDELVKDHGSRSVSYEELELFGSTLLGILQTYAEQMRIATDAKFLMTVQELKEKEIITEEIQKDIIAYYSEIDNQMEEAF